MCPVVPFVSIATVVVSEFAFSFSSTWGSSVVVVVVDVEVVAILNFGLALSAAETAWTNNIPYRASSSSHRFSRMLALSLSAPLVLR